MNDENNFEDWSHPSRHLTLPRRRVRVHWWRLLAAAVACLLFWAAWHIGHQIADAYRVVFSS